MTYFAYFYIYVELENHIIMRLDRITITNMRLIGEQTKELVLDSTKNVVILLGDNGFGKTTILDAGSCSTHG